MPAKPSAQDRRLLALLLHLQRWPFDPITGHDLRLSCRSLEAQAQQVFPQLPEHAWPSDWSAALSTLCERGWLRRIASDPRIAGDPEAAFRLTPAGRNLARGFHRKILAKGFGELLVDALDSPAYASFCRLSMGCNIGHFSPVDATQLSLVLALLMGLMRCKQTAQPFRWLDLGCGAGSMAAWLARRLMAAGSGSDSLAPVDAVAYGVDLASDAIAIGRCRHADLGESLRLHVGDVHDLGALPAASFDALLAVDVLAFLDEPEVALRGWLRLLAPGGRLMVLGSSRRTTGEALLDGLGGGTTPPPAIDLTPIDRHVWRSQQRVLADMAEDFEVEGRLSLYHLLLQEARRCGRWAEEGATRRYLTVLRAV